MKSNIKQRIVIIIFAIMVGVGVPELMTNYFGEGVKADDKGLAQEESNLEAVKFIRTVDGDTIIVEDASGNQQRVRMIGIDTPESVAKEEERNNEYGVMASDYTKQLFSETDTVYLEYDIDDDDQYDRTLAYIWLQDVEDTFDETNIEKYMVNAIIVKDGYGVAKRYEPTVAHDDTLQKLMNEARDDNTGLWQYQGFKDLW
ncbi:thermonuclease family protein [Pseudobutyrivibrio sp. MD2005]|uniref:thermonuclease family protein n=1 Tax=Pseudobutyrivibrio sp. MD2005 TaxID=1410616 RepID=UPI0006856682|nr:thermonuclease family protein [Pseudobutyrivibrio sp. MD2005]